MHRHRIERPTKAARCLERVTRALGLSLSIALFGARAWAAPPEPHAVELLLVGPVGRDPTFQSRAASWFEPTEYSVTTHAVDHLDVRHVLRGKPGTTHVWVTLPEPSLARLYFANAPADGGKPIYLLRDVRLDAGLDEIGSERVAAALHLSTLALLSGQAESSQETIERAARLEPAAAPVDEESRPEATRAIGADSAANRRARPGAFATPSRAEPRAASVHAERREAATSLAFGVGYGATSRRDEGVLHGPRGSARIGWGPVGGVVFVQANLPATRALDPVTLDLWGISAVVAAQLRFVRSRAVELSGYAGPGLDLVTYGPGRASDSSIVPSSAETEARPKGAVGLTLLLGRSVSRLALVAEVGVSLLSTRYYVLVDGSRREVGYAGIVSPTLGLELSLGRHDATP